VPPAAAKQLVAMRNCALRMACNGKTHVLAFRTPATLDTLEVNFTGKTTIKAPATLPPLPAPSVLRVQIVRVGELDPKKDKLLVIPDAKSFTEIRPKEPVVIQFTFTDDANNVSPQLILQLNMRANGGKLSGDMVMNPPQMANGLAEMVRFSRDTRNENMYKDWKKKAEGEKDPKDPIKTRERLMSQQKVWLYDLSQKMADCDVEYRVYMLLDGEEIDLIRTEKKIKEVPEPKRGAKRAGDGA